MSGFLILVFVGLMVIGVPVAVALGGASLLLVMVEDAQPHLVVVHRMIAGVEALDADPNVGAVYYGEMAFLGMDKAAQPLAEFAHRASKPFVACWQGGPVVGEVHAGLRAGGVIAFDTPTTAIRALKGLHEYGRIVENRPPAMPARSRRRAWRSPPTSGWPPPAPTSAPPASTTA